MPAAGVTQMMVGCMAIPSRDQDMRAGGGKCGFAAARQIRIHPMAFFISATTWGISSIRRSMGW